MVLIIGATSFLGPPVISGLIRAGYRIRCMLRTGSNREKLVRSAGGSICDGAGGDISFCSGNLLSPDSMISLLRDASAVVYMVDMAKTGLLENFLRAVSRTDLKRVVFISSTTVLTPLKSTIKESKIKSEELVKKTDLDYTILRPSMIYGSGDDPNFSRMIQFIKKRGFFITFGNGKNLIQPVHIGDVAGAVTGVLENIKTFKKTYNLAGLEPITYNEMLDIMQKKTGINFRVIRIPAGPGRFLVSVYSRFTRHPSLTADQVDRMGIDKAYDWSKAKDDFGFSPVSFEEGLEKLIHMINANESPAGKQ